jgi:indolepyruvate ferredoxin oxidoreductase
VQLLYNADASRRPSIVGKTDESGAPLLPSTGELTPAIVARAIVARLKRLGDATTFDERMARLESFERMLPAAPATIQRTPFFCSGCPHNTSTQVPDGSRAMAGIGCHSMALFMPDRYTATITQMGGEGTNWIGQAPFTTESHVFQNLGDGTYAHSGLTAIRAAAAAGVNITYKILYNDAVAMTGGQPVEGHLTVPQIARQVLAEGAKRIIVVTDEPGKYKATSGFPSCVEFRHRDALDLVQRELRATPGLTILIYDQTCAAEKRRRRKRGTYPDPQKRVFINDAVCEGCGDCSEKSNCISVTPLETEFGRKRQIDQSSCNKDFSCLNGFCPSFVTVRGGTLRKLAGAAVAADIVAQLPAPPSRSLDRPYGIVITGVGGTGIITLGALLGMAAHLEGKGCSVLDVTGLAQKNGAVMSYVRIARKPEDLHAVRIAAGGADLLLGCDIVVAAGRPALSRVRSGVTKAVVNSHMQPTAAFVFDPDIDYPTTSMLQAIRSAAGDAGTDVIDATALATALLGDSIAANLFMLGYAFQKGLVPVSLEAIERAIELNGVAVESNKRTFAWGRLAAADRARVESLVRPVVNENAAPKSLAALIERRAAFLTEYQDAMYAQRYRDTVSAIATAEQTGARGCAGLAEAVALNLFKLMAYKDEYEVARLHTDDAFQQKLQRQFEGNFKLEYHLAPPIFTSRDPATGMPRKHAFGSWMVHAFRLLARMRRLRGTAFDIFGYTRERRMERQLIADYEAVVGELGGVLSVDNHALAVEIASLPEQIRGFGPIKQCNVERTRAREAELLAMLRSAKATPSAA